MNGMIFPSDNCYLPIHRIEYVRVGIQRTCHTEVWSNFVNSLPVTIQSGWDNLARERIKDWNGTLINDVVVFNTEQDKMWFILRWS